VQVAVVGCVVSSAGGLERCVGAGRSGRPWCCVSRLICLQAVGSSPEQGVA
jgi:hypothetical protein